MNRSRSQKSRRDEARALNGLGWLAQFRGDFETATTLHNQALEIIEDLGGDAELEPFLQRLVGALALRKGDTKAARRALLVSLSRSHWTHSDFAECVDVVAELASAEGSFDVAARLFGASEALRESLRTAIAPVDRQRIREAQELSRASLGEERYEAVQVTGRDLTLKGAVDEATKFLTSNGHHGLARK